MGSYLRMYLKQDFPECLHCSDNYKISLIIELLEEGGRRWRGQKGASVAVCRHSYVCNAFLMRPYSFVHGPQFAQGRSEGVDRVFLHRKPKT